jgi:hypothetical protein
MNKSYFFSFFGLDPMTSLFMSVVGMLFVVVVYDFFTTRGKK